MKEKRKNLWAYLKEQIEKEINKQTGKKVQVQESKEGFGDFSLPCFALSKNLGKPPHIIANTLAEKINIKWASRKVDGSYLNFHIDWGKVGQKLLDNLDEKYGKIDIENGKTVVIDYSCPNIGKPMHVGHIRSTILGNSLYRIFSNLGYNTIGINYLGDIGAQVGKLILAINLWGNENKIEKNPEKEMLDLYVKFHNEVEKNSDLKKQALDVLNKLEKRKDKNLLRLWKKIKKWSMLGFNNSYKILDVKFDETLGESEFDKFGEKIVKELLKKRIAFKSKEGTIIVKLKDYGLPDFAVLRSDGTALYSIRDFAFAKYKFDKYKFFKSVYVTGVEQKLYFQQIFKTLELLGYNFAKKCIHLPFGLLYLEEGRLSTREGRVVFLEDVLNKATEMAYEIIKERKMPEKQKKNISKIVGLSAVKYSILKTEPNKNIKFNWKNIICFEGDTGPYLLYTYARAKSILRKARIKAEKKYSVELLKDNTEIVLLKLLAKYPDVLEKAARDLRPHYLANYLYDLANVFNKFYETQPVIKVEEKLQNVRIKLVNSTAIVMKNGLALLGIKTIEKM